MLHAHCLNVKAAGHAPYQGSECLAQHKCGKLPGTFENLFPGRSLIFMVIDVVRLRCLSCTFALLLHLAAASSSADDNAVIMDDLIGLSARTVRSSRCQLSQPCVALVGIQSVSSHTDRRMRMRQTWMRHRMPGLDFVFVLAAQQAVTQLEADLLR